MMPLARPNIIDVHGELQAKEARRLTENARQCYVDAAAVGYLETVFRDIRRSADLGVHTLRYEMPGLDPRIIATVLAYLRICGYRVLDLDGLNSHPNANASTLVGGIIIWADEMPSLDEIINHIGPMRIGDANEI